MSTANDTNMNHSDRFWCSLPSNDPRFVELRALLIATKQEGRYSPVARMLGEYALIGYLLTTGKIVLAEAAPAITAARHDLGMVQSVQQHIASALAGMDFE